MLLMVLLRNFDIEPLFTHRLRNFTSSPCPLAPFLSIQIMFSAVPNLGVSAYLAKTTLFGVLLKFQDLGMKLRDLDCVILRISALFSMKLRDLDCVILCISALVLCVTFNVKSLEISCILSLTFSRFSGVF